MAITFDTTSSSGEHIGGVGGSPITWAHTTISEPKRALVVGIVTLDAGVLGTPQYNGVSMTQLALLFSTDNIVQVGLWGLAAPDPGTHDIVSSVISETIQAIGFAVSFYGVDQTTPFGTGASATDIDTTNPDPTVSVSAATGDVVVDIAGKVDTDANPLVVGSGQTEQQNAQISTFWACGMSTEPGATSVTMNWTNAYAAGFYWAIGGCAVKPFVATANTTNFSPFVGIATLRQWVTPWLTFRAASQNYRTAMQWQPPAVWALNFGYHDPNPPITLEDPSLARQRSIAALMSARRRRHRRCAWLLPICWLLLA